MRRNGGRSIAHVCDLAASCGGTPARPDGTAGVLLVWDTAEVTVDAWEGAGPAVHEVYPGRIAAARMRFAAAAP